MIWSLSFPAQHHRPACPDGASRGLQPFSTRDKASRYIAIAWSCRTRTSSSGHTREPAAKSARYAVLPEIWERASESKIRARQSSRLQGHINLWPRPQYCCPAWQLSQASAAMAIKNLFKTVFSSKTKTADDGRDQWPSRTSFILAAMGGCVGLGNILRYVSGPRYPHLQCDQY